MKKETFIKSTIILMIGGLLTKLLGILIKVIMTRNSNLEVISLYMLVMPTFSLMMAISQLGFASGISKVVSENKDSSKKILFSVLPISILINISLTILLIFTSKYIAFNMLKNENAYLPILAISLVLPFDSLSSILRGFFFGKEKMIPHVVSNLSEQIVRLLFMLLILPNILDKGIVFTTTSLILINVLSELISSLVLIFFLPKKFSISKSDLKPSFRSSKNVLEVALPNTMTRIVGTISYFFEPIILTYVLTLNGYSNNYIITQYGVINGFVMPILLLPGFFTNAISNALLPVISREYSKNNYKYIKRKLKQALLYSLLIGIPTTIIIIIFPEFFLNLLYKTSHGADYIRKISFIFILYYIEAPLSAFLQATNRANLVMYDNFIGILFKTISLFILSFIPNIGLYSLLISSGINILITTIRHIIHIKKLFKEKRS
ncbi:MAG: oligosaccharide flippase family protein [Bacilli bacterium]|nr:oligosaccharide flippase family protein [Bacilli bacterium]